jgi:hypothetical protein
MREIMRTRLGVKRKNYRVWGVKKFAQSEKRVNFKKNFIFFKVYYIILYTYRHTIHTYIKNQNALLEKFYKIFTFIIFK